MDGLRLIGWCVSLHETRRSVAAREKDAESLAVHTPAFVRVKRLFAKLLATPAAAALLAPPPPSATRGPLSS